MSRQTVPLVCALAFIADSIVVIVKTVALTFNFRVRTFAWIFVRQQSRLTPLVFHTMQSLLKGKSLNSFQHWVWRLFQLRFRTKIPHAPFPIQTPMQFLIRLVTSGNIDCGNIIRSPLFLHIKRAVRCAQRTIRAESYRSYLTSIFAWCTTNKRIP